MSIVLEKNKDRNKLLVADLNKKITQMKLGGGKSKLEKMRSKGKMPARERINCLLDKNSEFIEIGALAGYEMYNEDGGCPSGGVVVVMGYISNKLCVVVANDASVKAGAWFPISAKKKSTSTGNCDG
jgi:acetyl-CoA carboxylase carboxyltransferase component